MKQAITSCLILILTLALAGCGDKPAASEGAAKPSTGGGSSGNPLTAPADYAGALAGARNRATKTVDLARLNQAIDMFKAQEGRNPTNLNELVAAQIVNQLPEAPAGMKIQYDASSGKVSMEAK